MTEVLDRIACFLALMFMLGLAASGLLLFVIFTAVREVFESHAQPDSRSAEDIAFWKQDTH